MVVFDASAVLAFVFDERGADVVQGYLSSAIICAPNVTEIVTRLIDEGRTADEASNQYLALGLPVIELDRALALRAGVLRTIGRDRGLSLGDRACLALAERKNLVAVTADRAWQNLDLGVEIRLIR
jgi:PIN domain nuclease of toxin-antitoxin system